MLFFQLTRELLLVLSESHGFVFYFSTLLISSDRSNLNMPPAPYQAWKMVKEFRVSWDLLETRSGGATIILS